MALWLRVIFPLPNNLININSLIAEFIIWNLQWVPRGTLYIMDVILQFQWYRINRCSTKSYHFASFSYRLCNKRLQYNDILQNANLGQIYQRLGI